MLYFLITSSPKRDGPSIGGTSPLAPRGVPRPYFGSWSNGRAARTEMEENFTQHFRAQAVMAVYENALALRDGKTQK